MLLLRFGAGIAVTLPGAAERLWTPAETFAIAQFVIGFAAGILLIAGLWTPLSGTLVALYEVWIALTVHSLAPEGMWLHIVLAVVGVSVAMIGPGAWSMDARLFGRKRFDIDPQGVGGDPLKGLRRN